MNGFFSCRTRIRSWMADCSSWFKRALLYISYHISKFVILRKETAMKQYFDALEDIEAHKGERVEYTFALAADVPPREAEMLYQQMDKIAALRAGEQGKKFVSNAFATAI